MNTVDDDNNIVIADKPGKGSDIDTVLNVIGVIAAIVISAGLIFLMFRAYRRH